ncbi:DUF6119 family protein [Aureispira anguillae]|uniref:TIGR04141 family sporadically distributed protein n=1 Tax=Aureispira anguillae TaxID=2864201 RepID=A0A915YD73_9BACT|nr:TIGR04141 family sporadically distributed protein [Aureispira anguillae]BDS10937.1 TIGR04141 family sporadically distributed protein [Aureispira anguillae]
MNQNIKLYKVDKDYYRLSQIKSNKRIIERIIQLAREKIKMKKEFKIEEIPYMVEGNITYYLYVHNFSEKKSDWVKFFPTELTSNLEFDILNISILLFIDNGFDIFIVVGGKGFQLVIPFIDHTFGLSILSRLIKPEEDLITSINSRGITGNRSGLSEQFRNEFRMIDFVRFGKVPTELHITLSQNISNIHFDFLQSKTGERIKIYAGKSFKIKKNIDFKKLHKIVEEMGHILSIVPSDFLSTYIEIKNHRKIEEELTPLLHQSIFQDLSQVATYGSSTAQNENSLIGKRFKFDLSHPEKIAQFYEADYYILKEKTEKGKYSEFNRVQNKENIYDSVVKRIIELGYHLDFYKFRAFAQGIRVVSYSDGKLSTSASFFYHFTSEFLFENRPIFLVDNKWYELKNSFVSDLEFECTETIKAYKLPSHILPLPWDKAVTKKESEYNLKYDDLDNYIVLDTITPNGVELCDILYIEKDKIYLVHVKFGFDAALRELTNQVTLSARRLYEDKKSGNFDYLGKVYDGIILKQKSNFNYTKAGFISLFDKKITYVFAFASQLKHDYLVEENIHKYKSNIARYSLVQCNQDMKAFMYDLNIWQIRRNYHIIK